MNYNLEDVEDQIIATLKCDSNLNGCEIETHAGQINIQMFINPAYAELFEGLIHRLPTIYIRYAGRTATPMEGRREFYKHEIHFMLYVCASSLRARKESQRSCYELLRYVYDDLHGKYCNSSVDMHWAGAPFLLGDQITTANFNQVEPLTEMGGEDEKLVGEEPRIAVYSTNYKLTLLT